MRGKTKGKGMSTAFTDTYIRNLKAVGRYTDAATVGLNLQVKAGGEAASDKERQRES
jgi:hypothetical protein